ncbi:hypothetical protein JG687_00017130 [Phytophthora cactorum]|uniref:Secreted protein n=1 Tax=Phytophthora cactorum TaxID=29920 RepID=A0A8T1TSS1_9STRA|nr:hypothetical protein JG687_00017130 [Phytophthora cactorum]
MACVLVVLAMAAKKTSASLDRIILKRFATNNFLKARCESKAAKSRMRLYPFLPFEIPQAPFGVLLSGQRGDRDRQAAAGFAEER